MSKQIPVSFGFIGKDEELNCVGTTNIDVQYRKKPLFNGEKPIIQVECFLSSIFSV